MSGDPPRRQGLGLLLARGLLLPAAPSVVLAAADRLVTHPATEAHGPKAFRAQFKQAPTDSVVIAATGTAVASRRAIGISSTHPDIRERVTP